MSEIILDTSVSVHIVPDRNMLKNSQSTKEPIKGLNGGTFTSGAGDVIIEISIGDKNSTLTLKNAKWIPAVRNARFSVGRFISYGITFEAIKSTLFFIEPNERRLASGSMKNSVLILNENIIKSQEANLAQ